jgi:hypothetical protein
MARDATLSRVVEVARGVVILVRAVQFGILEQHHPFQQRRSHDPDSSDPGGPHLWARGSSGWMTRRHIRKIEVRRGREDTQYRCLDIVKICGMARRTEGATRRFLVILSKQYKHWLKRSVGMETLPEYALELERWEMMVSFYIQYRVLAYLDDFLICPIKAGKITGMRNFRKATKMIDKLLSSLALTRHPKKRNWVGSTRVKHLGCVRDTNRMRFYIAPQKIAKVHGIARDILRQARKGRRWVS